MNKRKLILLIWIQGIGISLFAQLPVMQVNFELETSVTYMVDSENQQSLTSYDKIALMPTDVKEVHSEIIFDNGDIFSEIIPTYPNGKLEDWQSLPSKVIITPTSREIYVADTLYSSYPVTQVTRPIPAIEFAPLYMGTAAWNLPMPASVVLAMQADGYVIIENTADILYYKNDQEAYLYNIGEMIEEHAEYENGIAVYQETTAYTKDANGYYVYDFSIERFLKTHRAPCYEKVVFKKYKNIDREYLMPEYTPSEKNGYTYEQSSEEVVYPQITAQQIGTTNNIEVFFTEEAPDLLIVDIKDLYGNIVLNDVELSRENNLFTTESLRTGVYNIIVTNTPVESCRFVFIQ
ncbi:MAG: hypothetical protein COA58_09345 [Bacteroidetes bacterium]|nr:MAG: hypothetical protein COA58_09345 [Bacteroidota bacterium]